MSQNFHTPASKVRGLGSAKEGTGHFIKQRVSAIALVFLVPWFLINVMIACRAGYDGALAWFSQPLNAMLLIATLGAAFYHMRLGMQVVIEDYIGRTGLKQFLLILNTFAAVGLFIAAAMSVLKIWVGA